MKHASDSITFYFQTKGFRHGAGGQPMVRAYSDNPDYAKGYTDGQRAGQRARRGYSNRLCKKLGLVDPVVKST